MARRGDRLKNQTQVPCMLSRMSSQPSSTSCRHAGGSRTAKRTPVARAVRMMCIVTSAEDSSEPVGKEQCCRQQNMNYVALTAHNI